MTTRSFTRCFDLDDRFRIPGAEHLLTGYKKDGKVARWEGIYDDKGRIMVAIMLNSDTGDSWSGPMTGGTRCSFRNWAAHRRKLCRVCDDAFSGVIRQA